MIPTTDPHPVFPWLTPERRGWIYRMAVALFPLLVLVGWLTGEAAVVLLGLVVAFLSTGVAAAHTPAVGPSSDSGAPYTHPEV